MKILYLLIIALLILGSPGCKEKPEPNRVDLEQIDVDDSNDYRHIFKEEIEKEKERSNKQRKKEF